MRLSFPTPTFGAVHMFDILVNIENMHGLNELAAIDMNVITYKYWRCVSPPHTHRRESRCHTCVITVPTCTDSDVFGQDGRSLKDSLEPCLGLFLLAYVGILLDAAKKTGVSRC